MSSSELVWKSNCCLFKIELWLLNSLAVDAFEAWLKSSYSSTLKTWNGPPIHSVCLDVHSGRCCRVSGSVPLECLNLCAFIIEISSLELVWKTIVVCLRLKYDFEWMRIYLINTLVRSFYIIWTLERLRVNEKYFVGIVLHEIIMDFQLDCLLSCWISVIISPFANERGTVRFNVRKFASPRRPLFFFSTEGKNISTFKVKMCIYLFEFNSFLLLFL